MGGLELMRPCSSKCFCTSGRAGPWHWSSRLIVSLEHHLRTDEYHPIACRLVGRSVDCVRLRLDTCLPDQPPRGLHSQSPRQLHSHAPPQVGTHYGWQMCMPLVVVACVPIEVATGHWNRERGHSRVRTRAIEDAAPNFLAGRSAVVDACSSVCEAPVRWAKRAWSGCSPPRGRSRYAQDGLGRRCRARAVGGATARRPQGRTGLERLRV
eukprot:scaffold244815_cov31-Tisochrysis_lutea.AAC.1